ncbi:LysR family transcriptional regulator [Thaumasiovibrio sp. DFM-14]|uniref:LysR family transcriptional regulator n=1 Tax=Thaumasiovibrio sp. DFM-14 TaxID=3384792 RepID=UPI0039A0FE46
MITIEQIHSFRQVYLLGSYSAAAVAMNKKRSTIRDSVLALEDATKVTLFEINGRKAIPTFNAHQLFIRAQNLSKQAEDFEVAALSLSREEVLAVTVFFDGMLPYDMLVQIDQQMRSLEPRLTINWRNMSKNKAYEMIEAGAGHLALLAIENKTQTQARIESNYLGALPLSSYCIPSSALAKQEATIDALRLSTQYMLDSSGEGGVGHFEVANTTKVAGNLPLLVRMMTDDSWVILTPDNAQPYIDRGQLTRIALSDRKRDYLYGIGLFHGLGLEYHPQIKTLLDCIFDVADDYLQ